MPDRYRLERAAPARGFVDSFLLGNGWLGAVVAGGAGRERFDINLDSLWSGGPLAPEAGEPPAQLLPSLREAIRDGDFLKADLISRQMQGKGWTASYQPLGALFLDYADGAQASGYRRWLDTAEAVTTTQFEAAGSTVRLDSFVSLPDGVLVALAPGGSGAQLGFSTLHGNAVVTRSESDGVTWLVATGRVPAVVLPNYIQREPAVVYGADAPDADGSVAAGMGFALVAALRTLPSGETTLIASAESGFRGAEQRPSADLDDLAAKARRRVEAALTRSPAELRQRHRDEYRSYFDRVDLDLSASPAMGDADPAQAELLFHFGRHLLIASSRPGTQAANLQGIWNVDLRPAWSSNYTVNINTQMNYWPAELAGLGDVHEPMLSLTRDLATAGERTARRYYGAAGAVVHHNTDLWRFTRPVEGDPQWANWPAALPWMAAHLWDHVDYGADAAFVADMALPVHRATVRFALDMLVPDAEGKLVASPSTSPEHLFRLADGRTVGVAEGVAMDQELMHEVLTHYLALVEMAPSAEDEDLIVRARSALQRLRPIAIGTDGQLLEWADDKIPNEPGHRHLSHLYGLFPGTRITETDAPAHFEAARRALALRLEHGTGHTGWSQAWVLCLAARLRDPALAERSISDLLGKLCSDALLVLHPHSSSSDGFIVQLDGNFGVVAGLVELLVQSHEGAISLLKTLPPSWRSGKVRGIRCRGGHAVDAQWRDGLLVEAVVTAGRTGPVVVEVPEGSYAVDGIGTAEAQGAVAGRRRMTWQGTAGERYVLQRT